MATNEHGSVTPQRIMELAWGFAGTAMIAAAVEHRVFDLLAGGPRSADEIAESSGASQRGIRLLLGGLVGIGLVVREDDRFSLAPDAAEYLVSDQPDYMGGFVRHLSNQLLPHWQKLPEIVRTGKSVSSVNQESAGSKFFREFVEDLYDVNLAGAVGLAEDLGPKLANRGEVKVLDIAAGSGVWGIALAKRLPKARIAAVDWPAVTPIARKVARENGLADRLETIEGDILEVDLGSGYQVATLGHILHSEGEERSRKLLKRVFDALAPGGVIAIVEFAPFDDRTGPPFPLIFGVNMLVETDAGDVFTLQQMSDWLTKAGFTQLRKLKGPTPSPILIGTKV